MIFKKLSPWRFIQVIHTINMLSKPSIVQYVYKYNSPFLAHICPIDVAISCALDTLTHSCRGKIQRVSIISASIISALHQHCCLGIRDSRHNSCRNLMQMSLVSSAAWCKLYCKGLAGETPTNVMWCCRQHPESLECDDSYLFWKKDFEEWENESGLHW